MGLRKDGPKKKERKTLMACHKFLKIYFGPLYKLPALQTKK
jgi:hypothetical protein